MSVPLLLEMGDPTAICACLVTPLIGGCYVYHTYLVVSKRFSRFSTLIICFIVVLEYPDLVAFLQSGVDSFLLTWDFEPT
jgi:hypothetical protein